MKSYRQQPSERLDYDVHFNSYISAGDSVVSATVVSDAPSVLITTCTVADRERVKVMVSGGVDGGTYKVTVLATTTLGLIKEVDFRLKVKGL